MSEDFWRYVIYILIIFSVIMVIIGYKAFEYGKILVEINSDISNVSNAKI